MLFVKKKYILLPMKKIILSLLITINAFITAHAQTIKPNPNGHINLYNESNKTIIVGVGNILPTKYTIPPGGSRWIPTGSDIQNIVFYSAE